MDNVGVPLNPDFRRLFECIPGCFLILASDSPRFTIVAVSNDYTKATKTAREEIVGKGLFEVFPDNPDDHKADGVKNLTASLHRVLEKKVFDEIAVQKYDIPKPASEGGGFEERYWSPENSPLLDEKGNVLFIYHHVTDVTEHEKLLRQYGAGESELGSSAGQSTQLERLSKLLVGREIAMVGLREELGQLKEKLGQI